MKYFFFTVLLFTSFVSAQAQGPKPKAKTATATPAAQTLASVARGEAVYKLYCLTCHQADGGGVPNMNPPLIKTSYVTGDSKKLIKTVLNGFPTSVDIDGESYSNVMPPHNFLKDEQIADVLTYVRNSFGNKGTAIKPAQVKLLRAAK